MSSLEERLIKLLNISSLTEKEDAISSWTEAEIRKLPHSSSFEFERIDKSLVIKLNTSSSKTLGLGGHFDTVPGSWYSGSATVDDDKIVGLGASDMKAGLAAMLELLNEENILNSSYNLVFIFYAAEEGPSLKNSIHKVVKNSKLLSDINLFFMLEPTDATLHLGCMGSLHADVKFIGKQCHSARPWEGENPIHKSGAFLSRLKDLKPIEVNCGEVTFKEVVSVTLTERGIAKNIIPGEHTLNLNYRFAPGTSISVAKERVKELINGEAEISFTDESLSCQVPDENEVLNKFGELLKPAVHPKQAYTDVAVLSAAGIPSVNFGPGDPSQAHQIGEFVRRDRLAFFYDSLRSFIFS